jgi:hypothetical protein
VPWSRPSVTRFGRDAPIACCCFTSISRTAGTSATNDAARVASPARSRCPTGSPLSITPGGCVEKSKTIFAIRATNVSSRCIFEIGVPPQRSQSDRAIHRARVQKIKSKVSRNGLRDC